MTRHLETDNLSNQDISSALAIGTYTADADRSVLCQFFADQVAGDGDYIFYLTLQVAGAGSEYVMVPKTTGAAAAGETAIGGQSIIVTVRNGDVVKAYLDGLAGDTTTPDTSVRWFEIAALQPTTADRKLDISATGEAGVDWANVGSPTTVVGLSGTTVKASTDTEGDIASLNDLSAANVNAEVVDVLRTDTLPDSYSADGAQPTIAQAILEVRQWLMERAVTSTTVTVKKPDGSTTALTFTLDDATAPTSITRAT